MFISDILHDGTIHYASTVYKNTINGGTNNNNNNKQQSNKGHITVPQPPPIEDHHQSSSTPVASSSPLTTITTTMPPMSNRDGYLPGWFTDDVSRLTVLTRNYLEGLQREELPAERRRNLERLDLKPASRMEIERMRRSLGLEK